MSHKAYWKLSEWPFRSSVGREFCYRSTSVEEAFARVRFLIENGYQLGLILGGCGVGKSTLLKTIQGSVLRGPGGGAVELKRISLLGMTQGEFFEQLSVQLGNPVTLSATAAWRAVRDWLIAATFQGTQLVLLLDDIDGCHSSLGDDLHRLLNLGRRVTTIVTASEAPTGAIGQLLTSHCELRIDLPAWDLRQTTEFVQASLERCGGRPDIFTDQAIVRLHEISGGVVRHIIQLADMSLVAAAVHSLSRVTPDVVEQVADEISVPTSDYTAIIH